jgi:hypothetical protein
MDEIGDLILNKMNKTSRRQNNLHNGKMLRQYNIECKTVGGLRLIALPS